MVVAGARTTSSSLPRMELPFSASTPITVKGTLRTRIFLPVGSRPGKRASATSLPRTATLVRAVTSRSVKKVP